MPLVLTQLVEGEDLDAVDDVLPAGDDLADLADVLGVVREPRDQDETNPDARGPAPSSDAVAERDSGSQLAAGRLLVGLLVAALDVQEHQIDRVKHLVVAVCAQVAGGIDARVHAHLLGAQQDALSEVGLHEDLAAGQCDAALRGAENAAVTGDTGEQLRVRHGSSVLHEERIGVVAVQAAQRATVEEHGHARTGAVNGGDELPRVNGTERALSHASQAFGTLQVRDLLKALDARTDGTGLGSLEVLLAERGNGEGLRHDSFFEVVRARRWRERGRGASAIAGVTGGHSSGAPGVRPTPHYRRPIRPSGGRCGTGRPAAAHG